MEVKISFPTILFKFMLLILTDHCRYSNEVTTTYKETPRTDPENKALSDLALRGLHLLSQWTSVVTELYSWKLLHPTDHHMNNDCPPEAEEYERVSLKFTESAVLVELILT